MPAYSSAEAIEPEPRAPKQAPYPEDAEVFEAADTPAGAEDGAPHVVEAEVVEPESRVPPDIAAMLTRMAELYQDLLRNKDHEIAALRQALDVTELSAANQRRELEMLHRLAKMIERENQRLAAELEEARRQIGQGPVARRGWLARLLGGDEEASGSTPQV
jgi:hypothetical protein